jgi:integrase
MSSAAIVPFGAHAGLETVFAKAEEFAKHSASDNTRRGYASDWRQFTAWCDTNGVVSLPAAPETIALYIADVAERLKPATLARHLAAVSKAHSSAGYESPCAMHHAAVKAVWSGIRRLKGTAQTQKAPLLTVDLRRIISALPDSLIGRRDAAILLLGFAGAFRRSELAALNVGDVEFVEEGLKVTLRRSKTDQLGQGFIKAIAFGSDPLSCPVRALRRWLDDAGITHGAIFRRVNRHGHLSESGISGQVVAICLKRACEAIGLEAANFSGHSLRAGCATQSAINGASEATIMRMTGHRSVNMVRRYIRDGEIWRDPVGRYLGL